MKTSNAIFLASAIGLPALQLSAHPMHQHDPAAFERVRQSIPANLPEDMQVILRQLFSPDRKMSHDGVPALEQSGESAVRVVPFLLKVVSRGGVQFALRKHRPSWTPAVAAYLALFEIKEIAQPQILEALRTASADEVRAAAAWLLGKLYRRWGNENSARPINEHVREAILGALSDSSPRVLAEAARSAGLLFVRHAEPELIALLEHESRSVRLNAASALGQLESVAAARPLLKLLKDPDEGVRAMAAHALGQIGVPWVAPELLPLLDPKAGNARASALIALKRLANPATTIPLIERLNDSERVDRTYIAFTLGEIGDARATNALVACLSEGNASLVHAAARSLGMIGDRRAVPHLLELLENNDSAELHVIVAEALGEIDDQRAVEPLIAALADPKRKVVMAAATALGRLNDARAIGPMVEALFRDIKVNHAYRDAIADGLCEIRDPSVIDCLIENLSDESRYGRRTALRTLNRLTGLNVPESSPDAPQRWREWKAQQPQH